MAVGTRGRPGGRGEKAGRRLRLGLAALELGAGVRVRALPACLHLQGERATGARPGLHLVLPGAAGTGALCPQHHSMEEQGHPRGRFFPGDGWACAEGWSYFPGAGPFREMGGVISRGVAFPGDRWGYLGWAVSGGAGPSRRGRALPRDGDNPQRGRGLLEGRGKVLTSPGLRVSPRSVGLGPPSASPS